MREASRLHIDHCFHRKVILGPRPHSQLVGQAWLGSPHEERLLLKARVFLLMLVETTSSEYIFQAMLDQRARLKTDQQLAEWTFTLSVSRCCQ